MYVVKCEGILLLNLLTIFYALSPTDENVEMMAERKAAEVLLNAIVLHIKVCTSFKALPLKIN